MTVDQRSTSTRTVAATKARTVAKVQRQAIEVLDRIELLPGAVLREMSLVLIEEIDRRAGLDSGSPGM